MRIVMILLVLVATVLVPCPVVAWDGPILHWLQARCQARRVTVAVPVLVTSSPTVTYMAQPVVVESPTVLSLPPVTVSAPAILAPSPTVVYSVPAVPPQPCCPLILAPLPKFGEWK